MKLQKRIVLVIILCLATLIVVGCGGAEQRKAKYLERGKEYLTQQNYDKAVIEFKNALQIDPKYAEAYFLFGQAEEALHNYQQAYGLFHTAVELNPDYFAARVELARYFILGGDLAKATEQIDAVLKKQPTNSDALLVKAAIAEREGKDEDAIKQAGELIKTAPSETGAYALLADIYFKQQKLENSIEILRQGITANPKDVSLHMSLATVYVKQGENDKAAEMLQECVTLEPQNLQWRVNLAGFLMRTNQLDKAEKVLRTAIEQDPKDAGRRMLLVEFLSTAKKDDKAAEQELLNGIKEIPDSSALRFGLAALYEQLKDPTKAMDVYRDIISRYEEKPEGLRARDKLATLLSLQGKQDEADKLTDQVLKENPTDNNALMARARSLLAKQDAQGAIAALRTVLHDQPKLVDAYLALADAYTLNKEPALAKEGLMKAVELNPDNVNVRLALAQYYVKTGDLNSATKTVDEALKLSPNDYDALGAKFQLFMARKDVKSAQGTLQKIKATYPDKPTAYYLLGQVYVSQHQYDAAEREFEQGLSRFKGSYQFMDAIVKLNLAQKRPEKAIVRLNEELAKEPYSRLYAHELLAEIYIRQKKYNEAEQAARKAIEANPTWSIPYGTLTNIYLARGDFASAEQANQQGLKVIPNDPQLLMNIAEMYERNQNYDKAIDAYERLVSKQPNNEIAANNLASLLLDHSTDPAGLKRAKELVARFESSTQPFFLDTLGWMYYRSGEMDKAIGVMEKVVKQAPAVPVFHYHLGMAYYKKGDKASAKIQLDTALEAKNGFPGIEEARTTLKQIQ